MVLDRKQIEKKLREAKITFSLGVAVYFTRTCMCGVEHPYYGKNQLDIIQMKTADADYKNKLFKNMVESLAVEIEYNGLNNEFYMKLEDNVKEEIKKSLDL